MGQYEKHVFVCTTGKVCPRQGALEVIDILRRNVKSAGLADRIRIKGDLEAFEERYKTR